MNSGGNNSAAQPAARKFVRLAIIVSALFLIRIFVDQLPMLHHAGPITVPSAFMPEQEQYFARISGQQFQSVLSFPDDRSISWLPGYIFPVSLANAAIDTLIFIVVLLGASELGRQIRTRSRRLPEAGAIIFLVVLAVIAAFAWRSYAGVVLPLLGAEYRLYDWLFLVAALTPILAAILIGYRKLDVITDIVIHATHRAAGGTGDPRQTGPADCTSCGKSLATDAKFCSACGSPVSAR